MSLRKTSMPAPDDPIDTEPLACDKADAVAPPETNNSIRSIAAPVEQALHSTNICKLDHTYMYIVCSQNKVGEMRSDLNIRCDESDRCAYACICTRRDFGDG